MTMDVGLAIFLIFTLWFATYSLMTSGVTEDQRAEMMDDEDLWP